MIARSESLSLKSELLSCGPDDGSRLKRIYEGHFRTEGFLARLLGCCRCSELEQQATWLIKRHLEAGKPTNRKESAGIVSVLDSAAAWQTTLHVLQCIRHLEIPDSHRRACFENARSLTRHPRNFVRAWAYDALFAIARQDATLRGEAMEILSQAAEDKAASVQARIRNLLKTK